MARIPRLASVLALATSVLSVTALNPAAAGTQVVWGIDIDANACQLAVTVHNDDVDGAIIPKVFYTIDGYGSGQLLRTGSDFLGKRHYNDHYLLSGPLPAGARGSVTAYDPFKPALSASTSTSTATAFEQPGAAEFDFPGVPMATANFVVADGGDCKSSLGSIRGAAFEDRNMNGKWDAGEPKMGLAWYKVTDGGNWHVCGWIGGDSTYGVPVKAGRYYVLPVNLMGYRTTTPRIRATVEAGQAALGIDIGYVKDPGAKPEACDAYNPPRPGMPKILEAANRAGTFTLLMTAVNKAGLVDTLNGDGPLTVFAPTDEAFAKLPAGAVEALLDNPVSLKSILLHHVIAGDYRAVDVAQQKSIKMMNGAPATIKAAGHAVWIDDSRIVAADILADNGVIHVIDSVLLPPTK